MKWTSDYSVEKLFISKQIRLVNEKKQEVIIRVPTIAEAYQNKSFNIFLHIFNDKKGVFTDILQVLQKNPKTDLELCWELLLCGHILELKDVSEAIRQTIKFIFQITNFKMENNIIWLSDSLTLDEDLFNYVLFILRKSEGMKVEPPRTFKSEADRQRYLEQLAREEKIRKIRSEGNALISNGKIGGKTSILNSFTMIIQAFPTYNFEQLFNMCFEQIVFLQQAAGKILKYQIERSAYAAGNLKKLKGFWE